MLIRIYYSKFVLPSVPKKTSPSPRPTFTPNTNTKSSKIKVEHRKTHKRRQIMFSMKKFEINPNIVWIAIMRLRIWSVSVKS